MLLLLAGCVGSVDADQARLCRMALPALDPDARVEVVRTARWPEPRSVRVDYRALRPDRPPLVRFAVCRFAAEGLSGDKADLVGLATDRGPVSGAALYLLKHYYLETVDALGADPGPGDPLAELPVVPPIAAYGLQQLLVGLPRIATYGLLATAYALVFGLVGRINLAFGELAAVGAAATGLAAAGYVAAGFATPLPGLVLALGAGLGAAALHGGVAGHLAFTAVGPSRTQASLIATVGLSLALREYLRIAGGPAHPWMAPVWSEPVALARAGDFTVTVTPVSLVVAAIGAAAAASLLLLMARSRFGLGWRALADDPKAATLFGIDPRRVMAATFALSGAVAGLVGAMTAIQFGALGFADGFALGLKALAAAILGGVGSVAGGLAGGLAIGVFETLWSAYLPIEGRDLALHAVLVLTIIVMPDGLVGARAPAPAGS